MKNKIKVICLVGEAGTGKAQPVDTIIPTPNGMRRLGDLKIGDYVYDRLGHPTQILQIFPQGEIPAYQVDFNDGRSTVCGGEHLWTYITSKKNFKTVTTVDLIKQGLQKSDGTYKYAIPTNKPIEFEEKQYDIDPYVIGAFLGDGCCTERILTLSSNDEELVNEIAQLIGAKDYYKLGLNSFNWKFELPDNKKCYNKRNAFITLYQTNVFFQKYIKEMCCYSYEKRIPLEYKQGSIEQRYALIQGLMDTDGSISIRRHCNRTAVIRYTSINYNLIKDIQEVLWSLGIQSSYTIDKRAEKYTTNCCYSLHISVPNKDKYKLFRLSRKRNLALQEKDILDHKVYSCIKIKNITPLIEKREMVCIYVDNKEHLYLTNDYIVTHNTTIADKALEIYPDIFHNVVTATTRPMREGEVNGKDYFFITKEEFVETHMFERSSFNGWYYGTPVSSLLKDKVNLMVLNPDGTRYFLDHLDKFDVKIIRLKVNDKERLLRQLNREENPNVDEIIRRYGTDKKDFEIFDKHLKDKIMIWNTEGMSIDELALGLSYCVYYWEWRQPWNKPKKMGAKAKSILDKINCRFSISAPLKGNGN